MMPMNPRMNDYIMQLLASLGLGGGNSLPRPANPMAQAAQPPQQPGMAGGMGGAMGGMGGMGGPPPGMGWRRPDFPGQGHAYGRMGMSPPQQPTSPVAPAVMPAAPMTAASAATAPAPNPAPMARPANFGQTMSTWAQSKPDRPDNYSGAWGQSSQMDTWRNARPDKPMGR